MSGRLRRTVTGPAEAGHYVREACVSVGDGLSGRPGAGAAHDVQCDLTSMRLMPDRLSC